MNRDFVVILLCTYNEDNTTVIADVLEDYLGRTNVSGRGVSFDGCDDLDDVGDFMDGVLTTMYGRNLLIIENQNFFVCPYEKTDPDTLEEFQHAVNLINSKYGYSDKCKKVYGLDITPLEKSCSGDRLKDNLRKQLKNFAIRIKQDLNI